VTGDESDRYNKTKAKETNMALVIPMTAGDTSPNITFNFSRADNSPVNFLGGTVKFIIQNPLTGKHTNPSNNVCTITGQATCTYAWNLAGTDVPTPGIYKCEVQISYPDGQLETYKVIISAAAHI
jgi:hypothetical protein